MPRIQSHSFQSSETNANLTESITAVLDDSFEHLLELQESVALAPIFILLIIIAGIIFLLTVAPVCLPQWMVGYGSPQEREENYAEWKKKWLGSLMESDHMQQMSEYKKKLLGMLLKYKFGASAEDDMKACTSAAKKVLPKLLEEAFIDIEDVHTRLEKAQKTNHKAVLRVFRHFLGVFLLKHGRAISDPNIGLAGLGLGECGKVLCAGDLEYKLDTSGWHMCTWNCTDGQVPNKFKAAFKSDDFQAMSSDDMAEEALRDVQLDFEDLQGTKFWKAFRNLKYEWTSVHGSTKPLAWMKMKSDSAVGDPTPRGFHFEGKCSPPSGDLPFGALMEVESSDSDDVNIEHLLSDEK